MTLPLRLAGTRPAKGVVDEVLERVGLAGRRRSRPGELSGGQQQRVALARALVTRPAVVFGDEPTGALDTRTAAEVLTLLRPSVDEAGQTLVMVTHDPLAAARRGPGRLPRRRQADRRPGAADRQSRSPGRCRNWAPGATRSRRGRRPGSGCADDQARAAHAALPARAASSPSFVALFLGAVIVIGSGGLWRPASTTRRRRTGWPPHRSSSPATSGTRVHAGRARLPRTAARVDAELADRIAKLGRGVGRPGPAVPGGPGRRRQGHRPQLVRRQALPRARSPTAPHRPATGRSCSARALAERAGLKPGERVRLLAHGAAKTYRVSGLACRARGRRLRGRVPRGRRGRPRRVTASARSTPSVCSRPPAPTRDRWPTPSARPSTAPRSPC